MCFDLSYSINFSAKNPPEFLPPLWNIPAPDMGRAASTDCKSINGMVDCPKSFSRSVILKDTDVPDCDTSLVPLTKTGSVGCSSEIGVL